MYVVRLRGLRVVRIVRVVDLVHFIPSGSLKRPRPLDTTVKRPHRSYNCPMVAVAADNVWRALSTRWGQHTYGVSGPPWALTAGETV